MARITNMPNATRSQASPSTRRRTRSQSAEPLPTSQRPAPRRTGNRARQSSVDSDRSDSSIQSIAKRRKLDRRAVEPELSIVAEGPEDSEEEVGHEEHNDQGRKWGFTETSPRESQYSGTTAYTSHSQEQMRDMDASLIIDHLPELFNTARGLLDLLAPKKVSTQDMEVLQEYVEGVLRDLKVPGSRLSQKLKRKEDLFQASREHYGATEFIELQLTLRKLFNTANPANSESRPDAVLYTANLATVIKDILVKPKENQSTNIHLRGLQAKFPQAFLSTFGKRNNIGASRLLEESFDLALDVVTQAVIADLLHPLEDEDMAFEPDRILASSFYGSVPGSNLTTEELDDFYNSEPVLDILRNVKNSNAHKGKIRKRVSDIRSAFRYASAAAEHGDLVDFEVLNENYPWLEFITNIVIWSRLRLDELISSVEKQGGAQSIAEALEDIVDVDPDHQVVSPPKLQPAAEITSKEDTQYTKKDKLLQKLLKSKDKQSSELVNAPGQSKTSVNMISSLMAGPSRGPHVTLSESNGDSEGSEEDRRQSLNRVLLAWEKDTKERNKENLLSYGTASSRNQLDVSDPRGDPGRSSHKHPRNVSEDEESDDSEGSGFQSDSRVPNPNKRVKLSANRAPDVSRTSNNKRHSKNAPELEEEEEQISRQNRVNLERALHANLQEDDEMEIISSDEEMPRLEVEATIPDSTQARAVAKVATARVKAGNPPRVQKRKPWSVKDELHLIELIENYGTSWAILLQHGRFEREETQVGLKDKARNLKVAYMKSGTPEAGLPINFDRIPLGKKEWRAIRAAQPTLFPDDDEE